MDISKYKGKTLLILAGAEIHCKVVEAAKEMGIHTIVTDYLQDSPAKFIADEKLMYDIFDVDGLVAWGKVHHIDGVLGFCCDPTQKPAQEIADRLGLPTFGTDQQVLTLTKKPIFKQFCIAHDVDVIPTYIEQDVMENRIQYPVIVKPTDSRGSRGITICSCKEELLQALDVAKMESCDGKLIIEKYMSGHQDLTISYMVKDGQPILMSIGDRYSGRKEDHLRCQLICTIQPSRYIDMYIQNVNDRVVRMIQSLGIQNGPVFMQGFVDGNTVRMYDPGIRFPGNEYERIFAKATGLNPMQSIISYCVGDKILGYDGAYHGSYDLNGKCAIQYMINVGPGRITKFQGLEEIAKHECVIDIQQKRFVGTVIKQTGDIQHRAGEISILVDRDLKKMKDVIAFIQDTLVIEDEHGQNMLISPFVPENIEQYYGGYDEIKKS